MVRDATFNIDRALGALRERGRRSTKLKRAVLRSFMGGDCALTAEEIADRIGVGTELSPLYRCLSSLEEAGVLTHLYLGDGGRRYDLADEFGGHHHHLVCEKCSRIARIDGCILGGDAAAEAVAEAAAQGYVMSDHEIVLRGVCAGCRDVGDAADGA